MEMLSQKRLLPSSLHRSDVLVGTWMLATVLAYYLNFLFLQSLALSYGYAVASYGIGLVYARYDATIRQLLTIGTIGGFVELLGDYFLVNIAGTLAYPSGYPHLLSSPAYMPFAWAILIAFMGYVGIRLGDEVGAIPAYIGPAILAFIAESGYESLASQGGGWVYAHAPLGWIGHAPLFIVLAEAVMFLTVFFWVRRSALVGGLGMGLTITLAYIGVYYALALLTAI
jgi:hypothetical protein